MKQGGINMPTTVFFNLSKEKQERIIKATITEFHQYKLEDVSIKRIVESAKIARGSFYQYFNDVDDLFIYILSLAKEKIQFDKTIEIQTNPSVDFIEFVRKSFLDKIEQLFDENTIRFDTQIVQMIMASEKAQRLFIENMGFVSMVSEIKNNFSQMNFHQIHDPKKINIVLDMTFVVIEQTIYKLLRKEITKEEAIEELNIKLYILSNGINRE